MSLCRRRSVPTTSFAWGLPRVCCGLTLPFECRSHCTDWQASPDDWCEELRIHSNVSVAYGEKDKRSRNYILFARGCRASPRGSLGMISARGCRAAARGSLCALFLRGRWALARGSLVGLRLAVRRAFIHGLLFMSSVRCRRASARDSTDASANEDP
jgi:hypothetical protein